VQAPVEHDYEPHESTHEICARMREHGRERSRFPQKIGLA
jgi:hypothetical protein